jgi:hypothetical protein
VQRQEQAGSPRLPWVAQLLLVPSWVTGLGAILIALDIAMDPNHRFAPQPFARVVGLTVMLGALVAPIATTIAALVAVRKRAQVPSESGLATGRRVWLLIGLSFACVLWSWLVVVWLQSPHPVHRRAPPPNNALHLTSGGPLRVARASRARHH